MPFKPGISQSMRTMYALSRSAARSSSSAFSPECAVVTSKEKEHRISRRVSRDI